MWLHLCHDSGVCVFMISYLSFLSADLRICQAVSFGQDWNYVDFFMQGLHKLHIQRSKTDGRGTQTHVCVSTNMQKGWTGSVALVYLHVQYLRVVGRTHGQTER